MQTIWLALDLPARVFRPCLPHTSGGKEYEIDYRLYAAERSRHADGSR